MRLGIIMDPIGSIHYKKDSTLAMLWEASKRGYEICYFEQSDLFLLDGVPYGDGRLIEVNKDPNNWYEFKEYASIALAELDVILMRKDPPFNDTYIYTTYILDAAEAEGVVVVNRPQSLRDANEKVFASFFPQCSPPSVITSSPEKLLGFWETYQDVVCKPLNSMGGYSVFRIREDEVNANVIFELLTQNAKVPIMAQQFIPDITKGDKRILLIDGEPIPFALARLPQGADWRGNLAVGAKGVVQALSSRDHWICEQVGAECSQRGLYFVGIDIIGDFLTEINVTSPTGIRELEEAQNIHICAKLFNKIESLIEG